MTGSAAGFGDSLNGDPMLTRLRGRSYGDAPPDGLSAAAGCPTMRNGLRRWFVATCVPVSVRRSWGFDPSAFTDSRQEEAMNQLESLKQFSTVVADTGDIDAIARYR